MRLVVTLGVDTHADVHVAAALDQLGRLLGTLSIPATTSGYHQLLRWAHSHGDLRVAGVEGTGSYGVGLARFLISNGVEVLEVGRPNRQERRRHGKSDPRDAESAARSVLAGTTLGIPKLSSGPAESIRLLRVARRSAIKARVQAGNQLRSILVTSPEILQLRFRSMPTLALVRSCALLRPRLSSGTTAAPKFVLRSLSRRYLSLSDEISALDQELLLAVAKASPELLSLAGVGPDTAGALLVAAGDNPERLRSESSFAHLCGVAPVPASSGKTTRHRLNRSGNRDANRALHVVALSRMSFDARTQEYVSRRISEGKTKKEIIRCLKRYIAREVYKVLI